MSTAIENAPAGHDSIRWQRDIPLRYKADVAVIGGGIAGVCAACAAAAEGASVILVERFAVTGGNATIGGVANWAGETHGQGAIFDEIIAKQEEWKSIEPYPGPYEHYSPRSRRVFDHEILAVILQEMLLAYGVKLLLHTRFVDAMHEGRRVGPALLAGASGLEGLDAKVFVDASGGAELARAAGCTMLPEGQYGPLPASIEFFVREMPQDKAVAGGDGGGAPTVEPQLPAGWFSPVRRREDLPMTSPWPNGPDGVALKVKVIGHHSGDTEELTALEIAARRRQWEVLDYFQTQEKKPWRMDHTSPIIALRETRRIAGDYVLTVDDLRAGRAPVPHSLSLPRGARRGQSSYGRALHVGRPACALLGPHHDHLRHDGAGRRHSRRMGGQRGPHAPRHTHHKATETPRGPRRGSVAACGHRGNIVGA